VEQSTVAGLGRLEFLTQIVEGFFLLGTGMDTCSGAGNECAITLGIAYGCNSVDLYTVVVTSGTPQTQLTSDIYCTSSA
jgi:hypothetical protein